MEILFFKNFQILIVSSTFALKFFWFNLSKSRSKIRYFRRSSRSEIFDNPSLPYYINTNLDFSDRPYMAKNDFLGTNSEFFINLGLWIFVIFNDIQFSRFFYWNKGDQKIHANFVIFMELSYFFVKFPIFLCGFIIFWWNWNSKFVT